jgi:hypothetical protein
MPLLAGCGMFVALAVFLVAPGGASAGDSNAATALIDRSREAASTHEFTGTMVVSWRVDGRLRSREVDVVERDGVLHLGDDRIVGAGARRLLKTGGGWKLLWSGAPTRTEPDPTGKYDFTVTPGPAVAGRPVSVVVITRTGEDHARERMYFDQETELLLRRDQFDDRGRLVRRVGFVTISAPQPVPAHQPESLPKPTGIAAQGPRTLRQLPDEMRVHSRVGDGFELLGTYGRAGGGAQLYYSDGLFGLSLFERAGDVAWDELPPGGRSIDLAGSDARMYPTPAGSAIVWGHEDVTYTCVTDAPLSDVAKVVQDIDHSHGTSTLEDMGRFVTGPFSWG